MRSPIAIVDVDRPESWRAFRKGLCDSCQANCCTMPLEIRLADWVRLGLVDAFEAEHVEPRLIARRLQKAGWVERYHHQRAVFTVARRGSGDCVFLDGPTRRCTVYAQRPQTCRDHPQVGPRPGHCPYGPRLPATGR